MKWIKWIKSSFLLILNLAILLYIKREVINFIADASSSVDRRCLFINEKTQTIFDKFIPLSQKEVKIVASLHLDFFFMLRAPLGTEERDSSGREV